MHPNPITLMSDRLDVPVEGDDLGLDADLFHKFAGDRDSERLAQFDHATGKAEMANQGRASAADDQDPLSSKHRRRHREDRARGK